MIESTGRAAPLKITLVDDSDLATAGLKALLEPFATRVVMVEHREAIARPDALDVVLYEPLGLCGTAESLLRDLQRHSQAQTAVYSWAEASQLPLPTARPYLSKNDTASRLVVDLEDLVAGRLVTETIDQDLHELEEASADAVDEARALPEAALKVLTARECDIVALIVAGMSNREIGDELSLSINSVKTYIRTAYRKMGVQRRTQAMLWALEHGLGDRPEALVG